MARQFKIERLDERIAPSAFRGACGRGGSGGRGKSGSGHRHKHRHHHHCH